MFKVDIFKIENETIKGTPIILDKKLKKQITQKYSKYQFEYIKIMLENNNLIFIYENFGTYIISKREKPFNVDKLTKIIFQILTFLKENEEKGKFIRLFTPYDININEKNNIKIKSYYILNNRIYGTQKLFIYIPPEFIFYKEKKPISSKHSLWCLGILILNLLNNNNIKLTINDYISVLKSNQYDSFFDYFIEKKIINEDIELNLKQILYNCLVIDVDKRNSIDKLFENQLFIDKDFLYDNNLEIIIPPLTNESKELLSKKIIVNNELSSLENYVCLKERYKKDFLEELYKKNILRMKPKIFNIPEIISEDYNINNRIYISEIDINLNAIVSSDFKISIKNQQFLTDFLLLKTLINKISFTKKNIDELESFIKKSGNYIPSIYRKDIYLCLLDIDKINDVDDLFAFNNFTSEDILKEQYNIINDSIKLITKDKEERKYILKLISALTLNVKDFQFSNEIIYLFIHIKNLCEDDFYSSFQICKQLHNMKYITLVSNLNYKFIKIIFRRILSYYIPTYSFYLLNEGLFDPNKNYLFDLFSTLFSKNIYKTNSYLKILDLIILYKPNILYLIIEDIIELTEETVIKELYGIEEIINLIYDIINNLDMNKLFDSVTKKINELPQSLIPIEDDFNEEIIDELKKNEFLKERWWEFENFNIEDYKAPIIYISDLEKFLQNIILVDVRNKPGNKIKNSINVNDLLNNLSIEEIEKKYKNKIFVLIGERETNWKDLIIELTKKNIKKITILKGGINIIESEESDLIE